MQKFDIGIGTFVNASKLADQFNLAAGAAGRQKVARTLEQAIDFIDSTIPKLDDGWRLTAGNPYAWDIPVLDKQLGGEIARKLQPCDEVGALTVSIRDAAYAKAANIRNVFNLKSDEEVARLALTVYGSFRDGVWRGNGYSYDKDGKSEHLDVTAYYPKP